MTDRPTLSQRRGHEFTRILAFGAARGENVVPNDDLVGPIDSSDEWIRQRTGIVTRMRAGKDVEAVDLAEAAALEPTSMAAVLGGDPDAVAAALEQHGLVPANHNGGGQTVVAGAADAIAALAADPPARARVVPLAVAGAFHTRYMAPAVERVAPVAAAATVHDPTLPIWTNADGSRVDDGRRFVDLMVQQIANPVHWDSVMESFSGAGVTGIIELAPAGALVGLAKRGLRGTPTVAIKTPDDLPAAIDLLQSAGQEADATA